MRFLTPISPRRHLALWVVLVLAVLALRQVVLFHDVAHGRGQVELGGFAGHQLGDAACDALDDWAGGAAPPVVWALVQGKAAAEVRVAAPERPLGRGLAWRRGARGPPMA